MNDPINPLKPFIPSFSNESHPLDPQPLLIYYPQCLDFTPGSIKTSVLLDLYIESLNVGLNVFPFLFKLRLVCFVLFDYIQTLFCMSKQYNLTI